MWRERQNGTGPGRLPTSIDVAVRANVSQSTVSRALRGDPSIAPQTRDRVARLAFELGYRPDSRAARLREGRVGMIAAVLLFPEDQGRHSFNPFYYEVLAAVEAAAARRGFGVLLSGQCQHSSWRADFEQRREADGIILIGTSANRRGWRFFETAHRDGARIVAWGAPEDELPTVRADNYRAGELAAEHLTASGRTRLAFLGPGWEEHAAFRQRRQGFLSALSRRGLDECPVVVPPGPGDRVEEGEAWTRAAAVQAPDLDGIFAACDGLAVGAMGALKRLRCRLPAVVGFDGGSGARHYAPGLTTIEQDVAAAGELLVTRLLGGKDCSSGPVPVRLVVRESSLGA